MSNTPKNNRTEETAADQHLIDGFNDPATTIASLVIASATVQKPEIVATLQSRIDSRKAVESARAAWQTTVQADRTLEDKTNPFVAALRGACQEICVTGPKAGDMPEGVTRWDPQPSR